MYIQYLIIVHCYIKDLDNLANIVAFKIYAEGDPNPTPNNCEIWMQGPEPYATRISNITDEFKLIPNLALDQWYDFCAKAPSNATGYANFAAIWQNFPDPNLTIQPNNPEPYHAWYANDTDPMVGNPIGIAGWGNDGVPAGQTQYMGSMRLTSPSNTAQAPNPYEPVCLVS